MKPPSNVLSFNELVSLWESKIRNTLHKTFLPEDQILKKIEESAFPENLLLALAICYAIFVKEDNINGELEAIGLEATELYPEVKYTAVEEYLSQFVQNPRLPSPNTSHIYPYMSMTTSSFMCARAWTL